MSEDHTVYVIADNPSPTIHEIKDDKLVQTNTNNGRIYTCELTNHASILKYIVELDKELWATRRVLAKKTDKIAQLQDAISTLFNTTRD